MGRRPSWGTISRATSVMNRWPHGDQVRVIDSPSWPGGAARRSSPLWASSSRSGSAVFSRGLSGRGQYVRYSRVPVWSLTWTHAAPPVFQLGTGCTTYVTTPRAAAMRSWRLPPASQRRRWSMRAPRSEGLTYGQAVSWRRTNGWSSSADRRLTVHSRSCFACSQWAAATTDECSTNGSGMCAGRSPSPGRPHRSTSGYMSIMRTKLWRSRRSAFRTALCALQRHWRGEVRARSMRRCLQTGGSWPMTIRTRPQRRATSFWSQRIAHKKRVYPTRQTIRIRCLRRTEPGSCFRAIARVVRSGFSPSWTAVPRVNRA